ncbi:MAG: hypothetical protein HZA53_14630 [Planctomycetes bacterium]|nr:hypothetical protein [Planctomycetota bacterium]
MRLLPPAALTLGLVLSACSGSDPKAMTAEGTRKLGAGDAKAALECFDDALAHLQPQGGDFLRASMGRFQALARLEPKRAQTEFLAFHVAHPNDVKEAEFKLVVDELLRRGSVAPATDLIEAGQKAFPNSPLMAQLLKAAGDAAKKSGDPAAVNKLKGLGYAGDG